MQLQQATLQRSQTSRQIQRHADRRTSKSEPTPCVRTSVDHAHLKEMAVFRPCVKAPTQYLLLLPAAVCMHPAILLPCRRAGRSRVQYVGIDFGIWWRHFLRRDFFTTAVNAKLSWLLAALFLVYFTMLFSWALVYYSIWRWGKGCVDACVLHDAPNLSTVSMHPGSYCACRLHNQVSNLLSICAMMSKIKYTCMHPCGMEPSGYTWTQNTTWCT